MVPVVVTMVRHGSISSCGNRSFPNRERGYKYPPLASFSPGEFTEGVAPHKTDPAMDLIAVTSSSRFAVVDRQKVLEAFHGEVLDDRVKSKIDAAIHSLAVARSLTLVFDSSFETSSESPFLTAGARIKDLTADVISMVKAEDLP